MRKEDWQSAFGRPSREFERSVDKALESLPDISGAAKKEDVRAKAQIGTRAESDKRGVNGMLTQSGKHAMNGTRAEPDKRSMSGMLTQPGKHVMNGTRAEPDKRGMNSMLTQPDKHAANSMRAEPDKRSMNSMCSTPNERPNHSSHAKRAHGPKQRGRARQLLAMAACMVMLCGAALAVGYRVGVFDFLDRVMPLAAAPGLSQDERQHLLQSPALSIRGEYTICTLEEALFDGRSMTVSFRISPLDGERMLLMSNYLYNANDDIPEDWLSGDGHTGETFAERAAREGKQVVTVGASMLPVGGYDDVAELSYMENYNADGSITIFANMRLKQAVGDTIDMDCMLTEMLAGADGFAKRKSGFTIAPNMALERVKLGECDIEAAHIDGIELMRSQLGMYASATGTLNPGYEGTLVRIGMDEHGGGMISGGMALEAGASDAPSGDTGMDTGAAAGVSEEEAAMDGDEDIAMDDAAPRPTADAAGDDMYDASVLRRFSIDVVFKAGEGMPQAIWLLAQDEEGGAIGEPLKMDIDKDGGMTG
ncbi:MAG: hypothetical protein ACOYIH_03325 [Candidatus Fimadaptatus sp.]